jgi:putative acyl-CoA dehydrogenase
MMSATLMRRTLVEAGHHARHRSAFGARLVDQPLMRNVLADLALESEAATALTLRLAGAADRAVRGDAGEQAFRRIATAVGKYWVTKRGPAFTAEALECLGGNGYVEDSGMPRHYREAPLLSIWEGSGNVNALDVLRALRRAPDTAQSLFGELALAQGADARLDAAVARLKDLLATTSEAGARRLVEHMALTLQASLLVRHAPSAVADAFCATRLGGDWGHAFGTLPDASDVDAILDRALPGRN